MKPTYALAAVLLLAALPAAAQGFPERPTLTVQGGGTTKAKPDVARFSASVVTRAADLQGASDAHGGRAAKAAQAIAALRNKGVTTSKGSFTLRLERNPGQVRLAPRPDRAGGPETEGVATTLFDLEVRPVDAIDEVVTALAVTGMLEVTPVAYALDDPEAELDKARSLAMRDARRQAKVYAEAGDFRLGEILTVNGGGYVARPAPSVQGASAMPAGQGAPMQASGPATIDTEASVSVSWRILGSETRP